MKYKLTITRNGIITHDNNFSSVEAAEAWYNEIKPSGVFGQEEQIMVYPKVEAVYEEELLISAEILEYTEVIPSDYILDIRVDEAVARNAKLAQIAELEAQITSRRIREAVLSGNNSFIASIDQQIDAIRDTL